MKRQQAAVLLGLLLVLPGFNSCPSVNREKQPPFVQMEVKGIRLDVTGQSSVVILADKEGKRALPIWIGLLEAHAMDRELKNLASARPMTHDLLYSILGRVKAKVKEVKIVELKEHTYYATLFLKLSRGTVEVDARPSDAIVLALKSKAPIFVAETILMEQGISLAKKEEGVAERFGIRIQALTPALAAHFNFKGQKGVLVSEVISESPSEASGIKAGDIITKVGEEEVGGIGEFERAFDVSRKEGSVRVAIFRDEREIEITLPLNP